jgi:hypothetical protein
MKTDSPLGVGPHFLQDLGGLWPCYRHAAVEFDEIDQVFDVD